MNEDFKNFYKLDLSKKDILEYILISGYPDLLARLLNDSFYKFDYNFIFHHISKFLKDSEKVQSMFTNDERKNKDLLMNVVNYEFYNKDLAKMFAWFIGNFEYFEVFKLLVDKHEDLFRDELDEFNYFQDEESMEKYVNNEENYLKTLTDCLVYKLEDLAIALIHSNNILQHNQIIEIAIQSTSLKFLRYIWESTWGNEENAIRARGKISYTSSNHNLSIKNHSYTMRKSLMNNNFSSSHNNAVLFNKGLHIFSISDLVSKFYELKNLQAINEIISKWNYIENDKDLLKVLFECKRFDEISNLIWRKKTLAWTFTIEQFKTVIEQQELDLILFFLSKRACRILLDDPKIQKIIVEKYMKNGSKMYYGAEMLAYIYKTNWNNDLTKELCRNILKTIKTKDILNCHSPILTCVLLSEFLNQIGELSVQHTSRCQKVVQELNQFSHNIQESNPDENYIKFLMTQKDTRGRSTFQIASDNTFYTVLQTPEIGTIVKKMWNGKISHNGFFSASSLHRYFDSSNKSLNPFENFEKLDTNKSYFYQLNVWTDSCSLRYWPESFSTIILIIIYNLFIYYLVNDNQMLLHPNEYQPFTRLLFFVYIIWVGLINFGILNQFLYAKKTGRRFRLDFWHVSEIIMLFFALSLFIDTQALTGIESTSSTDFPFILQAILFAVNDILVWMRITGILLTFKDIGPLIRMIYLMSKLLVKYLVIYALYITCCAAIFTAIFHDVSDQFSSFSVTVTTLFGGFINNFDTFDFDKYQTFGAIMVMIYVTFSGVMLVNLLIALLSNVYETLSLVVDAAHRSVLIGYYRRFKWDPEYGYLILLTTPINGVNIAAYFMSYFCTKNKRERIEYNHSVSKIYFVLFYFSIIFLCYVIYTLLLLPFCYLRGCFYVIGHQTNIKTNKFIKVINVLKWFIFGFPFLMLIYFRDLFTIVKTVFKKIDAKSGEMSRIKKFIKAEDVVIFLQFIHGRKKEDSNDLHTLFLEYLNFEQVKKSENDEKLKEKSNYLSKLNSATKSNKKKLRSYATSIIVYNKEDNQSMSSSFIKKNLIVIEILENFLIDDGTENYFVDIEKLKMLLPKTMNINNGYIKRLVYTDVNSLNKAVNKLKNKKNIFLQYQLLNKIVNAATRLDKDLDAEIQKNNRFYNNEKEKEETKDQEETNKTNDLLDFDFYHELYDLLGRITFEVKEKMESKKKNDKKITPIIKQDKE